MGTTKGTIVRFCISFLAISWSVGSLGVSAGILPLSRQATLSSSSCNCDEPSSISLNPSYKNPSSTSLISGDNSAARKQQLLNQASILLQQLSSSASSADLVNIDTPCNYETVNQEKVLLQNLVNRIASLKKSSSLVATPSSSLPAVSQTTYNSLRNQYLEIRLLALDSLNSRDAEVVQSALHALYKTFVSIVTGQLLNVELPNLCSKTLALDTQLSAINAPIELQDGVAGFIKSITLALTGQSQVTILGLCDCLNDLETSVVTVVENDESQRLQYLLSSLVEAVTNAVVSGGEVGCNVIDVVKRYAASIKQAIREDTNVRARKIYNSVLNFEEELYKVLITSDATAITVTPSSETTTLSYFQTEKEYLIEISQLSKAIFGDSTPLVRSAVEILLEINKLEDQATSPFLSQTTLKSLKKVDNLLKSVSSSQKDSTQVIEALVQLLGTLPETDVPIILNALDPVPSPDNSDPAPVDDATAIVRNGELFVIKQLLVEKTDDYGNVIDIVQSGTYQLVDPNTNVAWSGSYVVENGTIQSNLNGNVSIKTYGVYNADLPGCDSGAPRVKRQANFELEDSVVVRVDENGYISVTEDGTYNLTDSVAETSKSGSFVVENTISKRNPDGTIDIIKSGQLYVNGADATLPSNQYPLEDGSGYFLLNDHIFESPDSDGNLGTGIFNIKNPETNEHQSGNYVIQQFDKTKNPDGSVDSTTSGLIYVNNSNPYSANTYSIPLIVDESLFTIEDHLTYVTDTYGNVSPISTGELTTTILQTGTTNSVSYVTRNIITTKNSDGSTDIIKFGTISCNNAITSSTESPTTTSSSSESTKPGYTAAPTTSGHYTAASTTRAPYTQASTTKAAPIGYTKHHSASRDFFDVIISRLNPVKYNKPAASFSTTQSPSTTAKTNTYSDATSIVTNGTSFIIGKLITPLIDSEGNVIGEVITGTYHLMDNRSNISWSGAFEVEDISMASTSPGNIELTASGTFDVALTENDWDSKILGKFSITDQSSTNVNEKGNPTASETGTYRLTDSTTGVSKSGTFVVENTASRPQPGGAIEVIKSGLLFLDESADTTSSPIEEPLISGYNGYFLDEDQIYNFPDSDGNYGSGVYSIKDTSTNESYSGTYAIKYASTTKNADGTIVIKTVGVIFIAGYGAESSYGRSISPSTITNGTSFTIEDHLTFVTDTCGHVSAVGKGKYTQTNPETGIPISESRVILNFATIKGDDGSTRIRKFGVFPMNNDCDSSTTQTSTYSSPTTQSPTKSYSSTHSPRRSHPLIPAVPKTANVKTLIESLNPIHPSTITQTNTYIDATSIVMNGTSFIIDKLITPLIDSEGNVIGEVIMGTYHLMDNRSNISWSGAFEVEEISMASTSPGNIDSTESGTFDVALTGNDWDSETLGTFSITDQLSTNVDEQGNPTAIETGTYRLTDSTTGLCKSGTFVVQNTVSRPQPGGAIEVIKSGLLFLDESDETTSSPIEKPLVSGYDGYFLIEDQLYDVPDSDGNYGIGFYNVKVSSGNESYPGKYLIKHMSTTDNADGSIDTKISGVIVVDGNEPASSYGSSICPTTITNGTSFTIEDHLTFVTDIYGHVSVVGKGKYTQTNPETRITVSESRALLNFVKIKGDDGSTRIRKFGVFSINYNCDSSTTQKSAYSSTTTQSPTKSYSSTHSPKMSHPLIPAVLKTDNLKTLVKSLNPIQSVQTPKAQPVSGSRVRSPIYDATAIVTNSSYFIIEGQVVTQQDIEGNVIGLIQKGNYSIRDPQTNVSWTGSFEVNDFSITSTDGETGVTASGTFDVIRPTTSYITTKVTKNQANFLINDLLSVVVDKTGVSRATEDGTYSLTNPTTGASTSGKFVVRTSVSEVNPDHSIHFVKSGVLYVGDAPTTVPSEQSSLIKCGRYALFNQHLFSVPDSRGNYGTGVYNIKDPVINEYTSGTYVIRGTSTVNNIDGTQDVTTIGLIYVDSSTSSSTSINTEPSLAIRNGAEFKFVDHLSYVTDAYGHVNVVGTGVFTQTDPQTNISKSGKYVIQDVIVNNNPDGSQDAIQSSIFYLTTNSDASSGSSSAKTTSTNDCTSSTSHSSSDTTLGELKGSVEALISYLASLKTQTNPASLTQLASSNAASATTSGSTSASVSNPRITSNYVVLERSNVVSAINGQCLTIGDIVIIRANSGAVLVATIRDSYSPVAFFITNLADLTRICATTNKVWTVLENDFSKQDRSLINAVLTPTSLPCSS